LESSKDNLYQYNVTGVKLVASGLTLSRDEDGEILFVEKLLPGENALVAETYRKGKTRFARIETLISTSEHRVNEPCEYVAKGCGGCDWQHIDTEAQLNFKREIIVDALVRIGKVGTEEEVEELVLNTSALTTTNYRTSARIFTNRENWGFKKAHSNETVFVEKCIVLNSETQQLAYDAASAYSQIDGENELSIRRSPDVFMGDKIRVSQKSFYQSHIDAPKVLTEFVLEQSKLLGDNLQCVDLYCGVGIFAIALAKAGHKVVAVEGNPHAVKDAKINANDLDVEVINKDVSKYRYQKDLPKCDLLVADPSREGITKLAIDGVLSADAKTIILISCDPAAGARDILLLRNAGYSVNLVKPFDLFGNTHHVEMATVLTKTS